MRHWHKTPAPCNRYVGVQCEFFSLGYKSTEKLNDTCWMMFFMYIFFIVSLDIYFNAISLRVEVVRYAICNTMRSVISLFPSVKGNDGVENHNINFTCDLDQHLQFAFKWICNLLDDWLIPSQPVCLRVFGLWRHMNLGDRYYHWLPMLSKYDVFAREFRLLPLLLLPACGKTSGPAHGAQVRPKAINHPLALVIYVYA